MFFTEKIFVASYDIVTKYVLSALYSVTIYVLFGVLLGSIVEKSKHKKIKKKSKHKRKSKKNLKKQVGQTSLEILVVLSIIVIVAVIVGVFYLTTISRETDRSAELDEYVVSREDYDTFDYQPISTPFTPEGVSDDVEIWHFFNSLYSTSDRSVFYENERISFDISAEAPAGVFEDEQHEGDYFGHTGQYLRLKQIEIERNNMSISEDDCEFFIDVEYNEFYNAFMLNENIYIGNDNHEEGTYTYNANLNNLFTCQPHDDQYSTRFTFEFKEDLLENEEFKIGENQWGQSFAETSATHEFYVKDVFCENEDVLRFMPEELMQEYGFELGLDFNCYNIDGDQIYSEEDYGIYFKIEGIDDDYREYTESINFEHSLGFYSVLSYVDIYDVYSYTIEKEYAIFGNPQTTLFNDFEDVNPLENWDLVSYQGGIVSDQIWEISTEQNKTPGGTQSVMQEHSTESIESWLISPLIEITRENTVLSFWSYNEFSSFYGANSVLISTTQNTPLEGNWTELYSPHEVFESTWKQTILDLSDFYGETIYVGFRYTGENGHNWYIDDVLISEETYDICENPYPLSFAPEEQVQERGFELELNFDCPELGDYTKYYKIEGIDDNYQEYIDPIIFDHPIGEYNIKAYVTIDGDESYPIEKIYAVLETTNIIFDNDFEGTNSLEGWTINSDGLVEWEISTKQNKTPGGTQSVMQEYSTDPTESWLISPSVSIDGYSFLSFWSYNEFSYFYDRGKNSVLISEEGNETWTVLYEFSDVTKSWEEVVIDLSDYIGHTINIGFKYEGEDAHRWYLDDIKINTE